jgi:hypothetical protein
LYRRISGVVEAGKHDPAELVLGKAERLRQVHQRGTRRGAKPRGNGFRREVDSGCNLDLDRAAVSCIYRNGR